MQIRATDYESSSHLFQIIYTVFLRFKFMSKSSDKIRCIQEYIKKDGTRTYNAEVRRKNEKPLRKTFLNLTKAKNWVRSTESAILEGRLPPETKAIKHTLNDLIERYKKLHLSRFPKRLIDQSIHLNWWS